MKPAFLPHGRRPHGAPGGTAARAPALAMLALACCAAWADAPLVSETSDAIDADACQVEAAVARAKTSAMPAVRGLAMLGSCGIDGRSQAALGYERAQEEGLTTQSINVFGKTALVAPEQGRTGYGLRYGVGFDKAPGQGWRVEGLELLGLLTREVAGGVLVHANLGHAHSRSARQGSTVWSLGIETVADTALAADVFGDDRSRPWVSAGIGRKFGSGVSASASMAVNFEKPRVQQFSLGAKLEF